MIALKTIRKKNSEETWVSYKISNYKAMPVAHVYSGEPVYM